MFVANHPTEDLEACNEVMRVANAIAIEVLGVPAQLLKIEGRPVFWWGDLNPKIVLLAHLDTVWPKDHSILFGASKEM